MLTKHTIRELAMLVRQDWKPVHPTAKPYLDAMATFDSLSDTYGLDSGLSIVCYFISNASTWRGDTARQIKAELRRRIKEYEDRKYK